ncbi:phosphonate transport system substrate-binding protein [Mycoplasmopsis mustelae]|uniref:Phosphonate transport system substrate-binding protein n=1 Tax=Mycoplasmopsis mustelae TaxID=171289 RepID=A0A4R7UCA0_9BACT|nr:hypothetical protein [Mycoplasmopsis mustelae]TDV23546.1 phosphonate transport system substrate-binding protein [Mycoplasmopsis mustelae]
MKMKKLLKIAIISFTPTLLVAASCGTNQTTESQQKALYSNQINALEAALSPAELNKYQSILNKAKVEKEATKQDVILNEIYRQNSQIKELVQQLTKEFYRGIGDKFLTNSNFGTEQIEIPKNLITTEHTLKLTFSTPQSYALNGKTQEQVRKEAEKQINDLLKNSNNKLTVKIQFYGAENFNASYDNLVKKEADMAFLPTGFLWDKKNDIINAGFQIKLQTLARQFRGDIKFDFKNPINGKYSDGSWNDDLTKIARNVNEVFYGEPRSEWNNDYHWNGSIYQDVYNRDNLVPYNRGSIILIGTEAQRAAIKKAWNQRDWDTFLSYGIVTGDSNSGAKYILQNSLLKKHFKEKFRDLKTYQIDVNSKHHNNITTGSIKGVHQAQYLNKHIFFDNIPSWAWTPYKADGRDTYFINKDLRPNQNLEVLTVTEALPYFVGVFGKEVDPNVISVISKVMMKLSKEHKDIGAITNGFFGYFEIKDVESEFWNIAKEVLDR